MDGTRLIALDLKPINRVLRALLNELKVTCRHDECQSVVTLEHLASHERGCTFRSLASAESEVVQLRSEVAKLRMELSEKNKVIADLRKENADLRAPTGKLSLLITISE